MDSYSRTVLALFLVIGLILACAWALRRFGGRQLGTRGQRRLGLVEALALDTRRRLVLIRRDEVEHLLLLGPGQDVVVETRIGTAAAVPSFDSHLPEDAP